MIKNALFRATSSREVQFEIKDSLISLGFYIINQTLKINTNYSPLFVGNYSSVTTDHCELNTLILYLSRNTSL